MQVKVTMQFLCSLNKVLRNNLSWNGHKHTHTYAQLNSDSLLVLLLANITNSIRKVAKFLFFPFLILSVNGFYRINYAVSFKFLFQCGQNPYIVGLDLILETGQNTLLISVHLEFILNYCCAVAAQHIFIGQKCSKNKRLKYMYWRYAKWCSVVSR